MENHISIDSNDFYNALLTMGSFNVDLLAEKVCRGVYIVPTLVWTIEDNMTFTY